MSMATMDTFAADKDKYHLFNPTPRNLMREMSTDRPDKTESAYTVDAGHFQFEMDVLSYSYDRDNGLPGDTRIESLSIAPVNLKVGLCNRADFQVVVETYTSVRTHLRATGQVERQRGFGDVTMRLKANMWGNDAGRTALALMPFVKLPTNQDDLGNNSVEGGLIAPLAVDLGGGWGMSLMTEVDWVRGDRGGHNPEFINTITFGHNIVGNLDGYIEFFSAVSTERDSDWVGTFDTGLTYGLTEDIQLDAGINIGVTRSADDWNPFLGLSWRF
jgi:outer membrane putative beta-barrel porin/alpha-amylase